MAAAVARAAKAGEEPPRAAGAGAVDPRPEAGGVCPPVERAPPCRAKTGVPNQVEAVYAVRTAAQPPVGAAVSPVVPADVSAACRLRAAHAAAVLARLEGQGDAADAGGAGAAVVAIGAIAVVGPRQVVARAGAQAVRGIAARRRVRLHRVPLVAQLGVAGLAKLLAAAAATTVADHQARAVPVCTVATGAVGDPVGAGGAAAATTTP